MLQEIYDLGVVSLDILLYGSNDVDYVTNCKIFDSVHAYIEATGGL
jgi:hypothetical protein